MTQNSSKLCIHHLFEQRAAQHPDQIAVIAKNKTLSYRELNEKANQLAHYLQQLGAVPESLIGICVDRSAEMIVALLGILKAGAAYVPLDHAVLKENLEQIIQDIGISVFLTQSSMVEDLPFLSLPTIFLDVDSPEISKHSISNSQNIVEQQHLLCYVVYRSFAAEPSKGIGIEHQYAISLAAQSKEAFSSDCWSGVLVASSISLELSIVEIFCTLAHGGTLILAEDLFSLSTLQEAQSVKLIHTVPSKMENLLAQCRTIPQSLHSINFAGEPLQEELIKQLKQYEQIQALYFHMKPVTTEAPENLMAIAQSPSPAMDNAVLRQPYPIDLSRLPAQEQQQLKEWNSTAIEYQLPYCIHQLIEQQVERTPEQIAVLFDKELENQQLTYWELNQRANQLARHLQTVGVGPDVLVGICLERSLDMIVALLAVFKAGGAYLPLDISYPVDRLQYMLENAQAPVLLTQSHLASQLPVDNIQVICLDQQTNCPLYATNNIDTAVTPENLGYVIYTSGSTGKPKGVAMPQRALANLLHWQMAQSENLQPGARTIQFTPISFDVSFQEIFATLAAGGTLVLITDEQRRNPVSLLRYLNEAKIERLFLPFVALRQLAEVIAREKCLPAHLKEVITAGEQLRITAEIQRWFSQTPECSLYNHYGPSESHVVTAFCLTGSPQDWPALPPIGQPIANAQIHLLDRHLRAVPLGVTGELYISGDCLAHGYLNRPEITVDCFIKHSWDGKSETILYKTGDLAQYLPDGNIAYLGRADQQVKIRGYRIEPGEIETLLERHSEVKEAVVITREASPGENRLVAYVIAQSVPKNAEIVSTPLARKLRNFLNSQVPEYMVPSVFMVLDAFPLTPSGKVDRRALPIPKWTRTEEGEYIPPTTSVEIQLSELWTELLGIEKVGIHDTFCSLGGHSLMAVQMIYHVKERMQIEIDLSHFLESPTIAGLARLLSQQLQSQGKAVANDDDTRAAEGRLDKSIQLPVNPIERAPNFFLTGATGFLGTYMLADLLRQTRADVYCLVRATRPAEGLTRLKNSLSRYGLWREEDAQRIIPVLGSLSLPCLGIQAKLFDRLAEKLDAIYHCGAWVNVIYPYSVLEAANVIGTQEILRLASQQRVKPVHYVSTVDVFCVGEALGLRAINEQEWGGPARSLYSGYAKSKYIAETLIQAAHDRGLPVTIYRPSNIMGDTQTGFCPKSSFIIQMLQGSMQVGVAPKLDAVLNLVPVDYVSRAIIHLSQTEKPCGKAFNIINPKSYNWNDLIEWASAKGYNIKPVAYESWCSGVISQVSQNPNQTLFFLTTFLTNLPFIQKSLGAFHFEIEKLRSRLEEANICCPEISDQLLERYFMSFTKQDCIPADFLKQSEEVSSTTGELANLR